MSKKFVYLLVGIILLLPRYTEAAEPPNITATSAILVEGTTGRVVYEKNADEERTPASMTKIMTCILALETLAPTTVLQVGIEAAQTEDSLTGVEAFEALTTKNVLTSMMLLSDNGLAVAVGESVDGTTHAFAARMNEKAQALGMKHTHFDNPHGLTSATHYSTARDMSILTRYALQNKNFRDIVEQKEAIVRWAVPNGKILKVKNTNDLLFQYPGCYGVKTGWTQAAGGCLAVAARRNGVDLVAIIMHSDTVDSRFIDAQKLLDYGFGEVRMVQSTDKAREKRSIWVKGGIQARTILQAVDSFDYPLLHGENGQRYKISYEVPKVLTAPVKKDTVVGYAVIKYDGKKVRSIPLTAEPVQAGFSVGSWLVGCFSNLLKYV